MKITSKLLKSIIRDKKKIKREEIPLPHPILKLPSIDEMILKEISKMYLKDASQRYFSYINVKCQILNANLAKVKINYLIQNIKCFS